MEVRSPVKCHSSDDDETWPINSEQVDISVMQMMQEVKPKEVLMPDIQGRSKN